MKGSFKYAALAALVAFGMTGCNSMKKSATGAGTDSKVVTLADGRKVVVGTYSGSDKVLTPPGKSKTDGKTEKPKKKGKNDQQTVAVDDRQSVGSTLVCGDGAHDHSAGGGTAAAVTAQKNPQGAVPAEFSINGEWTIYSVRENLVKGEERPYVTFDLSQKRFYGNNGCNYINGNLVLEPEGKIRMTDVISTLKMCQDDQFQYLINLALNDVRSFSVRQQGPLTFLDMKDNSGRIILVLRRHNMDFLNGAWKVTALNGTPLQEEEDATMTFDTTDLKIHGTTGCNIFNGEMFIDPDKVNSLQILKLATTRMACAPDSRETEFLLALEGVETARRSEGNSIVLCDADGKVLFNLEPMKLRDANAPE